MFCNCCDGLFGAAKMARGGGFSLGMALLHMGNRGWQGWDWSVRCGLETGWQVWWCRNVMAHGCLWRCGEVAATAAARRRAAPGSGAGVSRLYGSVLGQRVRSPWLHSEYVCLTFWLNVWHLKKLAKCMTPVWQTVGHTFSQMTPVWQRVGHTFSQMTLVWQTVGISIK